MISSHDHGNCELCDEIERKQVELMAWQENAGQLLEQALARLAIKDSYYADELRAALSVFHAQTHHSETNR